MASWRELRVPGLGPVGRVAALFQVGPPLGRLPYPSFKVKVLERADGSFVAVPNLAALGPDGQPAWLAGLGPTADAALEDALRCLARSLDGRPHLTEADFAWADPAEF